jgi:hypothetical protein
MTFGKLGKLIPDWIVHHSPDELQLIPIEFIAPSENNVRLFVERESLEELRTRYLRWMDDDSTILPDPPVVRYRGPELHLELLAGHRRLVSANDVGIEALPVRVVTMTDEEAYEFIVLANQYESVTTVELAFKAAEMERLGFEGKRIAKVLGGVSLSRYLVVGRMLHPDMFTDLVKRCNPGIALWYEAARLGRAHFVHCFHQWDAGIWNEEDCARKFRVLPGRRELPLDNKDKGIRMSVSKDGRKYKVIGTLDLDMYTDEELMCVFEKWVRDTKYTLRNGVHNRETTGFGPRTVVNYNPETILEMD